MLFFDKNIPLRKKKLVRSKINNRGKLAKIEVLSDFFFLFPIRGDWYKYKEIKALQ